MNNTLIDHGTVSEDGKFVTLQYKNLIKIDSSFRSLQTVSESSCSEITALLHTMASNYDVSFVQVLFINEQYFFIFKIKTSLWQRCWNIIENLL